MITSLKRRGNKIETKHKRKAQHIHVKRQVAVEVTQTFTRSATLNRNKGLESIFLLVETVDQPGRANQPKMAHPNQIIIGAV